MNGYYVRFFTQQNRECDGRPVAQWLLEQAREIGVRGATLFVGQVGFGHDGRFHSDSFIDLDDRPEQVVMALTGREFDNIVKRMKEKKVSVFYTKSSVEFGYSDEI